jgi:hypothetical protein
MTESRMPAASRKMAGMSVPFLWPMAAASQMAEQGLDLYAKNLAFIAEEQKIHHELRPELATANRVMLDLRTMKFRDYSLPGANGIPTIVDAPYAGHSAVIADYQKGQSLIETLLANGVGCVFLTDWKSATEDMKDLEIDEYLAEINVCVDDLGGRANLVGLCQGGWMCAMYAARFPGKVASLVLAGAPIDTDAGDGPVKRMAHAYPTLFYEELILNSITSRRSSICMSTSAIRPISARKKRSSAGTRTPSICPGDSTSRRSPNCSRRIGSLREHSSVLGDASTWRMSPVRFICWQANRMISPRRNRSSTPKSISEHQRTISRNRSCQAAISASSWEARRSGRPGPESRPGSPPPDSLRMAGQKSQCSH